jgi:hypothetical protein
MTTKQQRYILYIVRPDNVEMQRIECAGLRQALEIVNTEMGDFDVVLSPEGWVDVPRDAEEKGATLIEHH